MLTWQELSHQLQQITNTFIRFVKARRREEAMIGVAAILFWIGSSLIKWLPEPLQEFIKSWHGDLIIPCVIYAAGLVFLSYGVYRIWKLVHTPDLPPPANRPSAIKGPLAFTPADGELFRKLGREDELRKLLGYIQDDQVRLIVLMGASGAGKTSLLRAGLTDILKDTDIQYHYWEAVPSESGRGLLTAIQQSWKSKLGNNGTNRGNDAELELKSLDDLVNPTLELGKHVVVLDQFEQLGTAANGPVFRLLRKVIREAKPPHRVTWLIAFRREFRANWSDFIIPEHERGFFPPELSLRLFTSEQARDVIGQLIQAVGLSVEQKVINNLIEAATVEGEISSVDIGIGLLVLSELHERQGAKTLTQDTYHFAGGAEGLLTQYINRCLDNFPDEDRKALLSAMLALRDAGTDQRIAEGKSCDELAAEIEAANLRRLKNQLERLTQRDIRLLEHFASPKDDTVRYRLPHERLIPSLNRLAGRLIGEPEEAKGKLENVFSAWKRNNASQYLLRGRDLRLVERHKDKISWGKDEAEKLNFLKLSQRRRTVKRFISGVLIICITTCGWFAGLQYQRYDHRRYLRDSGYPTELYDYQQQLKKLELTGTLDVNRLLWLRSNSLEEFATIVADPTLSNRESRFGMVLSLDGLSDSLTRCPALKHLTLDISPSEVKSLEPLAKLPNITHLTLGIGWANLGIYPINLGQLAKLPNLTHLTLVLDNEVPNLGQLAELPNLTHLTLKLDSINLTELEPLARLSNLTQLNLDISSSFGSKGDDLQPLTKLPNLTQLSLDLSHSPATKLEPLAELPAHTNLIINIGDNNLKKLGLLAKVPNVTQLALDISDDKVTNLEPLAKLSNLTKLTLHLNGSQVKHLESLVKLPNLKQLYLNLHYDQIAHMESLIKLTGLTQLTLKISDHDLTKLEPLAELPHHTQLILDLHRSDASDLRPLAKLINLTQLYIDVSDRYSREIDLEPLSRVPNLTQLNLYISGVHVTGLEPLAKLPNSTRLNLDIRGGRIDDFGPLLKLNCQTLKLNLPAEQRMLLKAIPKGMTELSF